MIRIPPSAEQVEAWFAALPEAYVRCRTFGHGPESPYSVERPRGAAGPIEVTRVCACGRLVTRVYSADGTRLAGKTRTIYPAAPRYLALPRAGGAPADRIARAAIAAERAAIESEKKQ